MVSMRRSGVATLGSMARAARSSSNGTLTYTVTSASRASTESTSMSRSHERRPW